MSVIKAKRKASQFEVPPPVQITQEHHGFTATRFWLQPCEERKAFKRNDSGRYVIMVKIYVALIKEGKKTLEDVPAAIRDQVRAALEAEDK